MFPQGGNETACISITFPSSLQNTETRQFRLELFTLLSVYKYAVFVKAEFAFPLKREKFFIVTLYASRWLA